MQSTHLPMFSYLHLPEPGSFEAARVPRPFKCVILQEREVSADERWDILVKLVEAGCLYMMAWGHEATVWDDSIDLAVIERHLHGRGVPDAEFVMTSWHDDETLGDVLFFAKHLAVETCADRPLQHLLILDLGPSDCESDLVERYYAA